VHPDGRKRKTYVQNIAISRILKGQKKGCEKIREIRGHLFRKKRLEGIEAKTLLFLVTLESGRGEKRTEGGRRGGWSASLKKQP